MYKKPGLKLLQKWLKNRFNACLNNVQVKFSPQEQELICWQECFQSRFRGFPKLGAVPSFLT
jgi:hypothetical protein